MLHLLLVLLPLGLAASVSPVMLTEQTVLLATPDGRRTGLLYATGTVAVLVVLVGAIVLLGQSLSLPAAPHLDATLDVLIGALLCGLALMLHLWRRHSPPAQKHTRERMSPPAAFGFGVFSMATNVTTLALVIPAAKEIAASQLALWDVVVAAAFLVSLACVPAWGPVALVAAAPRAAAGALERLEHLIHLHGRVLVALLIAAAGVFLLVRGATRLAGL